jgi:uncharacterized protein
MNYFLAGAAMPPVLVKDVVAINLPETAPVSVPMGTPVAQLKWREAFKEQEKHVEAGVWECSPGVWKRQVLQAELCHFVSGHAFFTPDGEKTIEIKAGDAVFFPPNSRGTWDVRETIRKTYVTFDY